ncbi:MAG: hypothetical protein J5546_03135 [Lachnospiraceae bacterium]|nr:hypothetical protein [Lachnospiraceae bacterium]
MDARIILGGVFVLVSLFWGFVGYSYYTDRSGKREERVSKFLGRLFMLMGTVMLIVSLHFFYASIRAAV